jgi:aminoglycoside phosphotransferase family enzyme/predicted kinase
MSSSFPSALAGLLSPEAYPHPAGAVELIETHISWVLLAGDFAYKIKRPVRYPFDDLRSADRRRFFCEEELRLNRRFAPRMYLELCGIVRSGGSVRIGPPEGCEDYVVRMRRFPLADELDRLLDARRIEPLELETFGRALAQIHARLPAESAGARWGEPAEIQALLVRNLLECAEAAVAFGTTREILALRGALERALPAAAATMAVRRAAGRIRECHGDLHCGNLVRFDGRLVAFDSLEYEPRFRWIDVADEIAFLTSDLKARGWPLHAQAFRGGYLAESGDHHACRLLSLYEAHRALVRAKVAALSAAGIVDAHARETLRIEHSRRIAWAAEALEPRTPRLLLMTGLAGSGKTWLARQLAERISAVHIRSDVERKRRAGLREFAPSRSGVAQGIYTAKSTAAVYDDLARAAENVLAGGIAAVIDATFLLRAQRTRFVEIAARMGVPLRLISCEAPQAVLRARILERARNGSDASEANLAVLEWQTAHREAVTADEEIEVIRADTTRRDALERALREIGPGVGARGAACRTRAAARGV